MKYATLIFLLCIGCASVPQAPSAWSVVDSQTIVVTQPGTFRIAWDVPEQCEWANTRLLASTDSVNWLEIKLQNYNQTEATITNVVKTFYRITL